jgi:hypothetical protein
VAFPVDISYDAFNVDFKTVVQGGHGYFVQVKPGMHTDGGSMPDPDIVIEDHARGVLNVVGKPAGIYEYIFISSDNEGFCGMTRGEQTVVRVYLVPQLTGFPVLTNICPGETASVDFNEFLPPEIKYFIEEMGWSISYLRDGTPVTVPFDAGLSNVGNITYKYAVNDGSGEFQGKYSALASSIYACPEDSSYLTHTVRIREGGEYAIPNKSISFCTDVLSLVRETWPNFKPNLFGYLGSSMPNGKWSVEYGGQLQGNELSVDEDSGKADINLQAADIFHVDSIVFKYSYQDCMANDTFTLLTFNFSREDFNSVFVEREQGVCRNLMSGIVELSSIFGFTVPLTSGIWYEQNADSFDEMLYGAVDLSNMIPGSRYTFRYDVNAAVDSLCLIQGSQTLFHLRMLDFGISNAEVKVCKSQFASGMRVDLSRYVPGLSNVGNLGRITWYDNGGAEIANPQNYMLRATDEAQTQDTANYRMEYRYEVSSDCGPYSGSLYISAVDSIVDNTERRIVLCYTDEYASHVDLFQIMGIAGAENDGNFELCDDPVNETGNTIPYPAEIINTINATGRLNMSILFSTTNEIEVYRFCYNRNDSCMRNGMEITVVLTRNVKYEEKE